MALKTKLRSSLSRSAVMKLKFVFSEPALGIDGLCGGGAGPGTAIDTFLSTAFPPREQAQVVDALKGHPAKVLHLTSTMDIVKGCERVSLPTTK